MNNNSSNLKKTYYQVADIFMASGLVTISPLLMAYRFGTAGPSTRETLMDYRGVVLGLIMLPGAIVLTPGALILGAGLAAINTVWATGALSYAAYQDYSGTGINKSPENAQLPEDVNSSHTSMLNLMPVNSASEINIPETKELVTHPDSLTSKVDCPLKDLSPEQNSYKSMTFS